ncbi:polysaccharide lyase 6 family protein [Aporhodopirellula aestuarii]|uniref:Polysaccharide lyase 6 family protein n=1 Tax=Aporhodopirellula aestuarii TaxID=2950107 RepID=A0ABT0TYD7_9BACT|nr:polysaccharide lyase 6 family protein [Aporhodopirellula aestuarii]MCM2369612.1 polysaccharide lyase 6 family protein [Aporhodopirellula aestuarii]
MNANLQTVFATALLLAAPLANAGDHLITNTNSLSDVAKSVKAGDTITFAEGQWKDVDIRLKDLPGTSQAPITVQARTPGKTIITGASRFRFSGQHVVVKDFVFRDLTQNSDAVEFRADSKSLAVHSRLTQCVFDQPTFPAKETQSTHWLAIYGTNNRIDHCYLGGKSNAGTTLVVRVTETAGHHRIDHNHFGPRPELGENGGETIRVGTSDVSEFDSQTIVEDNYFEACDGEAEIISSKSCGNIYRRNVFDACIGSLTLRHGHRCLVEKNVFLGRGKPNTGGVRVIGNDHVVRNNYFEGITGTSNLAALCLYCGIKNSPLNGYAPSKTRNC